MNLDPGGGIDGGDSAELAEVQAWRGAAWERDRRPRDICLGACINRKFP
jgi:hypothetical protein